MPKTTMTQKELYFKKLEERQRQQEAAAAATEPPPRTTGGSVPRSNDESKTSGVFVNQGVYHPTLGVIALSYGIDAGYIARKPLKFSNT